jgi:hypothetical protein
MWHSPRSTRSTRSGPIVRRLRARDLGPPALAFLGATVVLLLAAAAAKARFFTSVTWTRWDAGIYLSIAKQGYGIGPCPPSVLPVGSVCGNAGWFPGYPALLAPLNTLGLPLVLTGVTVSWLFDFGVLVLLWNGFLRGVQSRIRYVSLTFAAFVPGGVYARAAYPLSMTAFFMLLCLLLLRHRHWLWAGVAGGLASFCYPTAIVIAPLVLAWVLLDERDSRLSRRLPTALAAGALAGLGLVATFVVAEVELGHWNAYFLVQAPFKHGFHMPLSILWPMLRGPFAGVKSVHGIWDAEAILSTLVSLVLLVGIGMKALARSASRFDLLLLALVLVLWLAPLTQADVSYWRGDVLLLPAALLLPKLPDWLAVTLAGAAVAVFPFLALFFFNGTLV